MKRRELAEHRAVLGFTPREAVRWLSPLSLARTALKVMAATVFADFGDKRELEGGFPSDPLDLDRLPVPGQPAQPPVGSRSMPSPGELAAGATAAGSPGGSGKDLWLDFAADLGDGFDATYSVALLLARETLDVGGEVLPRGKVLVLGGDEVYPVASPEAYEDRMAGPYRMAFPASRNSGPRHPVPGSAGSPAQPPAATPPAAVMLALPGNHDWYDGLTSFIRLFTRQRSIGAWRTIQTRSYFAVRLSGEAPHEGHPGTPGWWLLGLDSQLGQYIDEPQLDYFHRNVTTQLQEGDAIILCVASPYWVYADQPGAAEFRQVNFFEQDYLRRRFNAATGVFETTGAAVRLWLSGDLHHYSRYEQRGTGEAQDLPPDPARTQLITCGLGGAYLSDAHWLPQNIVLPPPASSPGESAAQPPSSGGRESAGQAPAGNGTSNQPPSGRRFTRMPGIYPQPADSQRYGRRLANPLSQYWLPVRNPGFGVLLGIVHMVAFLTLWTVFSAFRGLSFVDSLRSLTYGNTALLVFLVVAVPLVLLGILALLSAWLRLARRGLVVFLRGALYQLSALAVGAAVVILIPWPGPWPHFLIAALALALVHLGGWAVGSEAFAFFIQGTPGGEVASWRMSGQSIEDHKGFLRLHLAPDGSITVYPLAADSICRDWQLQDDDDGARLVPVPGLPAVRLLEQPVTIARKGN